VEKHPYLGKTASTYPNLGRTALKRLLRKQLGGEGAERRERAPPPARLNHVLARPVRSSRIVVNDGKIVQPDQTTYCQTPGSLQSTIRNWRITTAACSDT